MDSKKRILALVIVVGALKVGLSGYRLYHTLEKPDGGQTNSERLKETQRLRDSTYSALQKLGAAMQLARECGIPDERMKGAQAAYSFALQAVRFENSAKKFSNEEKRIFGTPADATAAFSEGVRQVHQMPRQALDAECPRVVSVWDADDAKFAKAAQEAAEKLKAVSPD